MLYTVTATPIPDVLVLEPRVHGDDRGFFFESYNERDFEKAVGARRTFVQDNHSRSSKGVLRGLHYQLTRPQAKLVRVVQGEIFDVVVDLRRKSPTFGKWTSVVLSAENKKQLWVPEGFAHGLLTTSDNTEVLYKTTDFYFRDDEHTLLWNDPALGISWPLDGTPRLAAKDAAGKRLSEAPVY